MASNTIRSLARFIHIESLSKLRWQRLQLSLGINRTASFYWATGPIS